MTTTAHLICGLPCSGKTTYAVALRADSNAVLFSLDRWLITSYGKYSIASVGQEEHTRRVLASRELIWDVACEFLSRSVDVILDDGFFLRDHRVKYVLAAKSIGAKAKIHYLDTPLNVIAARVARRNVELPPYNFSIDRDALGVFVDWFQTPTEEEGAEVVVVNDVSGTE